MGESEILRDQQLARLARALAAPAPETKEICFMKLFKIVYFSLLLFGAARLSRGAEVKTAMLEGTIISRNPATNAVTVQQSAVAGMMGAMTMTYEVRGQNVASLPKDGSSIMAMLHTSNGTDWLTD